MFLIVSKWLLWTLLVKSHTSFCLLYVMLHSTSFLFKYLFDVLNSVCVIPTLRNVSKVHDEWFADEEKVRNAVGLLDRPVVGFPDSTEVSICIFNQFHAVDYLLCTSLPSSIYHLQFMSSLVCVLLFWQLTCGICFESYPSDKMHAAACGHPFCDACWTGLSFLQFFLYAHRKLLIWLHLITVSMIQIHFIIVLNFRV